jgi:type I restriction enzyme S subunit
MAVSEIRRVPIRDVVLVNANSIKGSSAPSQIEYIDISSVGTGEFTEPPKVMSFADAPSRARRIVKAGDTILSTVRPNRRSFLFLAAPSSIAVASTGFAVLTPTPNVDARYLYYWVTRQDFTDYLSLHAKGAAYPAVSAEDIGNGEIELPPLPIQRRIAGILSAYDELIENSQRRIKILEAMARALYREWFVHFRFPGHESVPRVPSSLGEIPQGWEVKKLTDFVTTKYGYTESTNVEPVGPKYLRGMDINKSSFIDWSQVPYCPISQEDHETYRLKVGDVLVIRMADPGKVGIVEQEVDAVFASYLIRVAPKDERLSPYFLFYLMESAEYYAFITGASTGTTRKSASAGVIVEYPFALPPHELVEKFERRASELRLLLTTLLEQVVNLRRTRDLLLPRLLSGQIDMEAIDA